MALVGVTVALVVLGAAVFATAHLYRVPVASMEPTLHCAKPKRGCRGSEDDRIVVPRFFFKHPGRGDLVAFHAPPLARRRCGSVGVYVKRVVAVAGDTVAERHGTFVVNGRALPEHYVKFRDAQTLRRRRVPAGAYFVLGDNRLASCDSRILGPISQRAVLGRVVATYWPPSRIAIR